MRRGALRRRHTSQRHCLLLERLWKDAGQLYCPPTFQFSPTAFQASNSMTLRFGFGICCNNDYFVGACLVSFIDLLEDGAHLGLAERHGVAALFLDAFAVVRPEDDFET